MLLVQAVFRGDPADKIFWDFATAVFDGRKVGRAYFEPARHRSQDLGTVDSPRKEEDGFVLNATNAEKQFLVIEDKSKDPVTCDGEKIINRINFKGGGKKDYRSISFPAKAGETVKIYCASAKKDAERPVKMINADGVEVKEFSAPKDDKSKPITPLTFKVPATSTYTLYAVGGGWYLYQIKIEK